MCAKMFSAKIGANTRVVQSQSGQSIVFFFARFPRAMSAYCFSVQTRRRIKKTTRAERKTYVHKR